MGLGLAEAGALAEPVGLGLAEAGALAEPVGLGLAEACALAGPVGLGEGSGIWVTAWLGGAGGAELAGSAGR